MTNYIKHEGRKSKEGFTGECDILTDEFVRDIKSSWSIETFPFFKEDAVASIKKSGYDWQLRVYMMLYGVDKAAIDYCLTDTPEELIEWEDKEKHVVDHIPISKRVTSVEISRDKKIEKSIHDRYALCNTKFKELVTELENK